MMAPKAILLLLLCALLIVPTLATDYTINENSRGKIKIQDDVGSTDIRPINSNGDVDATDVDIKAIPLNKKTVADIVLENTTKVLKITKKIQIRPNSKIIFSPDGLKVRQSKEKNGTSQFLEIHYDYQRGLYQPWSNYVRVDSCKGGVCRIVFANFSTKYVWHEYRTESEIDFIIVNDNIPSFEEMQG